MYFVNVRAILMTAILTHVDQVTDLVRVGWTEEAVPQVSVPQFHRCQFSPIRYQWGGMNHCYVGSVFLRFFFSSCIGQHVGGAGCLHPPVTNKVCCQDRILELRIGNQYFLKVEDDEEI